jgi:hypothetical protein
VWVPATVAPGWVPYSTGRWIWVPRFGWTWLDDAPWGWAPYHYGRWVFVGNYWAWAPGPVVVRPVYSPALVVFLGGPVVVAVRPLHWAPLGWGEPVIPWWGRSGFVGVATWHGWGGPRVVNNVVVSRTTVVNVTNITVYKNVHVHNAVVGVPADRFGHGAVRPTRVDNARVRELTPVRGALEVKPVAASVMPAGGAAVKPPAAIQERKVVATRAPRDFSPALQAQGLPASRDAKPPAASLIVPAPKREKSAPTAATAPAERPSPGEKSRGQEGPNVRRPEEKARGPEEKARGTEDKKARVAVPPAPKSAKSPAKDAERGPQIQQPPPPPAHDPALSRQPPPRPQAQQDGAAPRGKPNAKPDPRAKAPAEPRGRGEREQGQPATPERPEQRPGR